MYCQAVIFDLDGTLVDTLGHIAHLVNGVLNRGGFPPHGVEDYRFKVGGGLRHLARMVLPLGTQDEETIEAFAQGVETAYEQAPIGSTLPYPGALELVTELGRLGVPMAILSNKPQHLTQQVVDHFFPEQPFHRVIGQQPNHPVKPDPCLARQILESWPFEAPQVAMVGDSDVDIQTAVNTGMFGVGAAWGFRGRDELIQAGAARIIESPLEMLELVVRN